MQNGTAFACRPESVPRGALALEYRAAHAAYVVLVPTRAEDAKHPLWKNWAQRQHRARLSTLEQAIARWPDANYAYLPEPSGLVVIDVDERDALRLAEKRFGETAVVIETGKKGWHLVYRGSAPSLDLRQVGFPGEVKGRRCLVVGPSSVHPDTGLRYRFACGSWDSLVRVPPFNRAAAR